MTAPLVDRRCLIGRTAVSRESPRARLRRTDHHVGSRISLAVRATAAVEAVLTQCTTPDWLTTQDDLGTRLGVELRLGGAATALDPYQHEVVTDGGVLHYGSIMLATGASAGRLAFSAARSPRM